MKLILEQWREYENQILLEQQLRGLTTTWVRTFMNILNNKLKTSKRSLNNFNKQQAEYDPHYDDPEDDYDHKQKNKRRKWQKGAPIEKQPLKLVFGIKSYLDTYSHKMGKQPNSVDFSGGFPPELSGEKADYRGRARRAGKKVGIDPLEAVTFSIVLKDDPNSGAPFTVRGSYVSKNLDIYQQGEFDRRPEATTMIVSIIINLHLVPNLELLKPHLSGIQRELYNTVAHELAHGRQAVTSFAKSGKMDIQKGIDYYLSDHEVEAFARGVYDIAKRNNVTFESMLDAEVEKTIAGEKRQIALYLRNLKDAKAEADTTRIQKLESLIKNREKLIQDLPKWKEAMMAYAKKQLPCAQKLDGNPIHPPGCKGEEAKSTTSPSGTQQQPGEAKPEDSFVGSLLAKLFGKK